MAKADSIKEVLKKRYFVNVKGQYGKSGSGEHEVHEQGCKFKPDGAYDIGSFSTCYDAVHRARLSFSDVDGCEHCSPDCHTK